MVATVVGPQAVRLHTPRPVSQLPGFADGDVSVQDAAAQRAAPLLLGPGLPPRARVLDACAAPGGKTAHLLELARSRRARARSRPGAAATRRRDAGPPAPLRPQRRGRRRRSRRLVGRPAVRRDPARRPVQRLRHRAPPPRRALAAPPDRHRRPRRRPGAPARRPLAAARAGRPAALLHLLGVQGRRPGPDRRFFCNDRPAPPWRRVPHPRATCCRCPTMPDEATLYGIAGGPDGFFYALLQKTS